MNSHQTAGASQKPMTWRQTFERHVFLCLIWIVLKTRHIFQRDWKPVAKAKNETLEKATWSLSEMIMSRKTTTPTSRENDEMSVRRNVARSVAFQFAYFYFDAVADYSSPTRELDKQIGDKFLIHGFCPRTGRTVDEFKQMGLWGQLELLGYLQRRTIGFGYILEDTIAGKYSDPAVTRRLAKTHAKVNVSATMYHRIVHVAEAAIRKAAGSTKEHEEHLVSILDCLKANMDTSYARAGIIDQ